MSSRIAEDMAARLSGALLRILLPALAGSAASAQKQLWTVDDDGSADFTTIQAAVDAATDGDVVLVRAGGYGGFTIDGKGVGVVGELAGAVLVGESSAIVRNTSPAQSVLLQNLEVRGGPPAFFTAAPRALVVQACLGPVAVQDCALLPNASFQDGGGARVDGSLAVSLTRCTLRGGASVPAGVPGHALHATASAIAAYDCAFEGGFGPGGFCTFGCGAATAGGDGARLEGAWLFASGSSFAGGDGGDGDPPCGTPSLGGAGADGGDGARLAGGSELRSLDCAFAHGTAGLAFDPGSCPDGIDGADVHVAAGTHVPLPGIARSLTATSPIVEGGVTTLALTGAPGDAAVVVASLSGGFLPLDPLLGVLLTSATQLHTVALGVIPASGTLVVPVPTVPHAPFDEVVIHHLQSGWLTVQGAIRLGSNASVVVEK